MYFSHLGVFLISVKPLTTEITENKTTPKSPKIKLHRNFVKLQYVYKFSYTTNFRKFCEVRKFKKISRY